jgi:hypothetical protein
MLQAFKKRRAIQLYRKKLGPYLAANYGKQKHYSPAQVKKGVEHVGLDPMCTCYGMAMFTSRDDFNAYHQTTGEHCDYNTMLDEASSVGSGFLGAIFGSDSFDSCTHGGHDAGGLDASGGGDAGD